MSDEVVVVRDVALVDRWNVSIERPQGTPVHQCPSTYGVDPHGIIDRLNAMGASTVDMDRDGQLLFTVEHLLAYPRSQVDPETGELHEFTWCVVIDPNGERWGTSSSIVSGKLGQLLALKSAGLIPWPVTVQFITRTARKSGRRYHDVVIIPPTRNGDGPNGGVDSGPPESPVAKPGRKAKLGGGPRAGD